MKYIALILVAMLALTACETSEDRPAPEPKFCTQDAKECPDGSFVSRDSDNNCEFKPCPVSMQSDVSASSVCSGGGKDMTLKDAMFVALMSECTEEGMINADAFCNENSGTWWIGLDVTKKGCMPACVVDVATKTAEINWRCTGLLEPQE